MIELQNLRKEYPEVVAVNDLEVTIPQGEVYGLIGPNGAGKTSTIRMACGLMTPTAGSAKVCGVDVHHQPELAQRNIGYLSDFFSVYEDLKVWEYLDYFAHAYKMPEASIKPRIDQVIAQVGLEVKHDAFIKGLSRGMKQRLGIARAVIHKPKVLLLDEPASGLDPKSRVDLRNLLLSLRDEGSTVLISSHILSELEGFCTSIGVMEKGRMIRSGRISQILSDETKETQFRVIRASWIGDGNAKAIFSALPGVTDVLVKDKDAAFRFSGTDDALADIPLLVASQGIKLLSFGEVKQTVEEIYLKLSKNEVM